MRFYSIIIPVYNRPEEVKDLLESLTKQTYIHFEVLVIEDGSTVSCKEIADSFRASLNIRYFRIENSGPALARNFGAAQSRGEYLLILDSDCILPACYVEQVHTALKHSEVDAFGGPDRAHASFSPIQKAINYAMTSFLTTGGIRGGRKKLDVFYPRSFNMGIKREVYFSLGGFSRMRYGEDIEFSMRIQKAGYKIRLFPAAYVFHKRRTRFGQFFRQVQHSGRARIELYRKYPDSLKLVHCLPALVVVGGIFLSMVAFFLPVALVLPFLCFLTLFADALLRNKRNVRVACLAVVASIVQLTGYGTGFIAAVWTGGGCRGRLRSKEVLRMEEEDGLRVRVPDGKLPRL